MNFIFPNVIQEPNSTCWQPYATSTPLKIFPNKIHPSVQKKLVKPVDKVYALLNGGHSDLSDQNLLAQEKCQPAKKVRKNRSCYYFEVSSSEDENSTENSRAIRIKIRAEKNSAINKSLSKTKEKRKEKDIPPKQKITPAEKLNTKKNVIAHSLKKTSPLYKLEKKPCKVTTRGKNITKKGQASSSENHSEIKNSIRNEVLSISNKNINKETLTDAENNGEKITNRNDFFNKSKCKNLNKTSSEVLKVNKLAEVTEKDRLISSANVNELGEKSTFKDPNDFRQPHSSEASELQVSNALKLSWKKRKAGKPSSLAGPAQKIKIKKSNLKPLENQSVLHSWDVKKNLSHQLFSESKEQELLNSLDLTDVKTNEEYHNSQNSSKENKEVLEVAELQNLKTITNQKEKLRRPPRQRQAPKEYWLPESPSPEPDTVNDKQQIKKELDKNKLVLLEPIFKNNNISAKATKMENKVKQCSAENSKAHVLGELIVCNQNNQETPDDNLSRKTKQTFTHLNKMKSRDAKSSEEVGERRSNLRTRKTVKVNLSTEKEKKLEEKAPQVEDNNNKSLSSSESSIPAVFKQLNQLSFNKEILEGCTQTDCWSLNNFKCGVLKIKSQYNLSSKNSQGFYFGGVLIVGKLKMKIGNQELDMKKGDLAFVPPLTEWTAANFSKTESVFYYWRGRFKTLK